MFQKNSLFDRIIVTMFVAAFVVAVYHKVYVTHHCLARSDLEKLSSSIEPTIWNVIKQNPEAFFKVISEAAQLQQEKIKEELETTATQSKDQILNMGISLGAVDQPKVQFVAFVDMMCPISHEFFKVAFRVMREKKDVSFRFIPLVVNGLNSEVMARFILAAGQQEKGNMMSFLEGFSDKVSQMTRSKLLDIAKHAGFDITRVEKTEGDRKIEEDLVSYMKMAESLKVQGTPTVYALHRDGKMSLVPPMDVAGFLDLAEKVRSEKDDAPVKTKESVATPVQNPVKDASIIDSKRSDTKRDVVTQAKVDVPVAPKTESAKSESTPMKKENETTIPSQPETKPLQQTTSEDSPTNSKSEQLRTHVTAAIHAPKIEESTPKSVSPLSEEKTSPVNVSEAADQLKDEPSKMQTKAVTSDVAEAPSTSQTKQFVQQLHSNMETKVQNEAAPEKRTPQTITPYSMPVAPQKSVVSQPAVQSAQTASANVKADQVRTQANETNGVVAPMVSDTPTQKPVVSQPMTQPVQASTVNAVTKLKAEQARSQARIDQITGVVAPESTSSPVQKVASQQPSAQPIQTSTVDDAARLRVEQAKKQTNVGALPKVGTSVHSSIPAKLAQKNAPQAATVPAKGKTEYVTSLQLGGSTLKSYTRDSQPRS